MEIMEPPPNLRLPNERTQHRIAMWNSMLWIYADSLTLAKTADEACYIFMTMMEAEQQLDLALYDQHEEMTREEE